MIKIEILQHSQLTVRWAMPVTSKLVFHGIKSIAHPTKMLIIQLVQDVGLKIMQAVETTYLC